MTKIIDRTGKGSSISQSEFDANYSSLSGINAPIVATSHTIDIDDQNDTIEYSNASPIAVTLSEIENGTTGILDVAHTDDFKVTLVNVGAGIVTITPDATDAINTGASTIVLAANEYVTIQTDSTQAIWNIVGSSDATNLGGLSASQFLRSDANDSASGDIGFSGAIDFTGTMKIGGVQVTSTADELSTLDSPTKIRAYQSLSNQTITAQAKVLFDSEDFDINSEFASSTFTADKDGYYLINAKVCYEPTDYTLGEVVGLLIKVNGSSVDSKNWLSPGAATSHSVDIEITSYLFLSAADTVEAWSSNAGNGGAVVEGSVNKFDTNLHIVRIG